TEERHRSPTAASRARSSSAARVHRGPGSSGRRSYSSNGPGQAIRCTPATKKPSLAARSPLAHAAHSGPIDLAQSAGVGPVARSGGDYPELIPSRSTYTGAGPGTGKSSLLLLTRLTIVPFLSSLIEKELRSLHKQLGGFVTDVS